MIKPREKQKAQSQGIQQIMEEREKRWNESFLEQKRKQYQKKYKLGQQNIYQQIFSFLNDNIKHKIIVNNQKKKTCGSFDKKLSINKYESTFENSSKEVFKLLEKKRKFFSDKNQNLPLLRKVKQIESLRFSDKEHKKILEGNQEKKINVKFIDRTKEKFANLLQQDAKQQKTNKKKENYIDLLNLENIYEQKKILKNFSKNSYLVSLNYDFSDPIL